MLVQTVEEVVSLIAEASDANVLLVAHEDSEVFDGLLIQPLCRPYNQDFHYFLALRNIRIKPRLQGTKCCSCILDALEEANQRGISVMVEDLISEQLDAALDKRGWLRHSHQKTGDRVRLNRILLGRLDSFGTTH